MQSNKFITKLKSCNFIIQNEYFNEYIKLVSKNDITEGYKELHHIFCKSFSKILAEKIDDSKDNLVYLLFKNHCKAHWLLYKCTTGEQQKAMANAFISMISFKNNKDILDLGLTDCDYQELQEYINEIKLDQNLNYWSNEEEKFLIENYPTKGQRYCAEALNKSLAAISTKARLLNISMDKWWSDDDISWLKANYNKLSINECCSYLNRTYGSIVTKASELNLTKDLNYSNAEKQFIIENYPKYGTKYCAKALGRTKEAIKAYATKTLKVKRLPQGSPIYCIELDRYFDSIKQASIELNMSDGNICSILNGRLESSKGLHFIKVNKEEYYAKRKNTN